MSDTIYMSSDLTHGKTLTFFAFPGGFEPDGGVDIKLRDVTMGRVMIKDGKRILEPFIQENPYIEVAFDKNASGIRELAGFRVGSEDSYGIQGNVIDVISGYITPEITAEVIVPVLGNVGTLYMTAPLGGVRTIGFIDEDTADVSNNTGGLIQIIEGIAGIEGLAPTAQLYPVQGNYLNHTRAFFLSANSKPIQWGAIGGYTPAVTGTGFWLNMGGDGRLEATTRELDHPINYFPGHPKLAKYGASTNYNKNVGQFSETYQ
jgi:hypothetical protein